MISKQLTALSAFFKNAVLSAGVMGSALLAAAPATAQVMEPQAMLNALGANCDRATEITYRSQILASPDRNTLVRTEGLLRKMVDTESPLRAVDTANYCYPDSRQTVSRQIILETQAGTRQLVDGPYVGGYILYHPRAFSSNSQFLALDMQIVHTDGNTGSYALFLNLENDTLIQSPTLCNGLAFQSYVGFASDTEAVVRCQGGLRFTERYEAVNLSTGTVRTLATRPNDSVGYGSIIRSFEVIKVQIFE